MITTSNVAPKRVAILNDLCAAGQLHEAAKLALDLDELMAALTVDTSTQR
jgi:dihydrodipicolinate synthase/N-acetylneuraminate lyase